MSAARGGPVALGFHLDALEGALRDAIGNSPGELTSAARYVMGWEDASGNPAAAGGKRIRPALCLFAAETLGGAIGDAMPGAVAIELVHNFSLVHDEVQDHDHERHHRPTIWARFGEGQAINVGDFLYTRAVRALTDAPGDVAHRMRALSILHHAISEMIEGQWRDIDFETRESVTPAEYLAMIAGKTGALLGAPLEIGAVLAGVPAGQAAQLGEWGRAVGLAFQIRDDYLGIWGDPGETGKSNTNDIARKKKTLPIVYGLQHPQAHDVILEAYTSQELQPADIQRVVASLEAAGAPEACRGQARAHADQAQRLLATLELGPRETAQFEDIAAYLIERRS